MKTKKEIIAALATVAPGISIETVWEHDPDASFPEIAHCFDDPDPDDWQAWESEVRASAIIGGELVTGSAYLCGTWERAGDDPEQSNPEISGYFPQMVGDALEELRGIAGGLHVSAAIDALAAA